MAGPWREAVTPPNISSTSRPPNIADLPGYIGSPDVEVIRPRPNRSAGLFRPRTGESEDFIEMLLEDAEAETTEISLWTMLTKFPGSEGLFRSDMSWKRRVYLILRHTLCTVVGIITLLYQAYNTLSDPTSYGYINVDCGNLPFAYVEFKPAGSLTESFILEVNSTLRKAQDNFDKNVTNDQDWNIDEALTMAYLVDEICSRDSRDYEIKHEGVAQLNLYDENVDSIFLYEHATHLKDNINDTVMTEKIIPFLKKGMIHCNAMIPKCWFAGQDKKCINSLQETLSDVGLGCGFNIKPTNAILRNPSLRSLFDSNTELESRWEKTDLDSMSFIKDHATNYTSIPYKDMDPPIYTQINPGKHGGLKAIVMDYKKEYACPQTDGYGFTLSYGNPVDITAVQQNGIALAFGYEHFVTLTPSARYADDSVRNLGKNSRDCYFSNDHKLEFYKKYTHSACITECLVGFIKANCGCKLITYPGNVDDYLCHPLWLGCVEYFKSKFYQAGTKKSCLHCKPNCNDVSYTSQVSSIPMSQNRIKELIEVYQNQNISMEPTSVAIVHVYVEVNSIKALTVKLRLFASEVYGIVAGMLGASNELTLPKLCDIVMWIIVFTGLALLKGWNRRMQFKNWICNIFHCIVIRRTLVEDFE